MIVTVNTDASCVEGFGGYAFWIVCDAGKIQKAGKLKSKSKNTTLFEMMCIANALYTLLHSKFTPITKIIINTDSQSSIDFLTFSKTNATEACRKLAEECYFTMLELCLKNGKSIRDVKKFIEFRHVKAHTKNKDKRSYVNEWCDKEAKKYAKMLFKASK